MSEKDMERGQCFFFLLGNLRERNIGGGGGRFPMRLYLFSYEKL